MTCACGAKGCKRRRLVLPSSDDQQLHRDHRTPVAGTFTRPDPLLDTSDPAQWNPYSYGAGNPVDSPDPTGLAYCTSTACGGSPRIARRDRHHHRNPHPHPQQSWWRRVRRGQPVPHPSPPGPGQARAPHPTSTQPLPHLPGLYLHLGHPHRRGHHRGRHRYRHHHRDWHLHRYPRRQDQRTLTNASTSPTRKPTPPPKHRTPKTKQIFQVSRTQRRSPLARDTQDEPDPEISRNKKL